MDTFRFWLALIMLMFMPGAVLFWFLVHPFVRFWRRLGLRRTMALNYTLLAASVVLRRKISRHLRFSTLGGLPELAPETHPQPAPSTWPPA
jgi:hypothetical protein